MRYAAQPIFAGIFAITLVLSNATRTLADGYVSWCIDQEISRVKEVAINNASEGSCFVTMQEPFEGSEQKVTTYTGQDWETCFNKGAELTQDIIDAADGYNCGAWSWAGNVAISHKKLMEGVLSTIQSYNETVRQWNEGEKNTRMWGSGKLP
ncbi:hypothetical protein [Rhizobium sp. F40D2]|uniref:hypothetical protein n=1 Tax=Rhizobium sp. F40D2 TaxID=3453141 RepID=UPI003F2771CD